MSPSTGLSLALLAACGADADVHLDVTRVTEQEVTLQLCEPGDPLSRRCKTSALFAANDPLSAGKTIDIVVTDSTPTLLVQFQLFAPNFCAQVALAPDSVDARITLPPDATSVATVDGCDACTPGPCE